MFIDSVQQSMGFAFVPFVTSSFSKHSLTATTNVVSGIIGGLVKLPLAKVLDIWGRPTGFLAMLICMILGLIMMAACNNVATFCAAQVFYWVG
jgi:MFS family permease